MLIESILFGRSKNADATNLAEKAKKASYKCQLKMPSMTVSHKTHAAQWRHGKMTEFHVSLWILPELTTKTLANRANKP